MSFVLCGNVEADRQMFYQSDFVDQSGCMESCQMAEAEECPGSIRLYEKISRKGILLDKM